MTKEAKKTQKEEPQKTAEKVEEVKATKENKVAAQENKTTAQENNVGLLLKEMRNKKGKSFSEISQDLCIRRSYLEAIENSDYNNIPEYPYGIGFIRSYADYLGLDGNKIVQMYKEEAEADFRKKHPYFVMEPQVEATVPSRRYLLISLIAVVVLYVAWDAYNRFVMQEATTATETVAPEVVEVSEDATDMNFPLKVEDYSMVETATQDNLEENKVEENPVTKDEAPAQTQEEKKPEIIVATPQVTVTEASFVEEKTKPETAVKEEVADTEQTTETKVEEKAKPAKSGLSINVLKETWIEVKNEKTLYISKVLQPGDTYTLPKAENLKLSVGKADGVEVLYNGKKAYEFSPNKKMNISVDEIIAGANN